MKDIMLKVKVGHAKFHGQNPIIFYENQPEAQKT